MSKIPELGQTLPLQWWLILLRLFGVHDAQACLSHFEDSFRHTLHVGESDSTNEIRLPIDVRGLATIYDCARVFERAYRMSLNRDCIGADCRVTPKIEVLAGWRRIRKPRELSAHCVERFRFQFGCRADNRGKSAGCDVRITLHEDFINKCLPVVQLHGEARRCEMGEDVERRNVN